jgi:anti-sigma factor RsiW
MTTCEDHEIALERQCQGALSAEQEAGLTAHLAGCEACRAYAAATRQMKGDMSSAAARYRNRIRLRWHPTRSDWMAWAGMALLAFASGALTIWPLWVVAGMLVYGLSFARPSGNLLADEARKLTGLANGLLGAAGVLGLMLIGEGAMILAMRAITLERFQEHMSALILPVVAVQMAALAGLIAILLVRRAELVRRRNGLR